MEAKIKEFPNLGMDQDTTPSKLKEGFAFENHNIRITSKGDSTVLSVTNEKGPKKVEVTIPKYLKGNKIYYDPVSKTLKSQHVVGSIVQAAVIINGFPELFTIWRGYKESSEVSSYEGEATQIHLYTEVADEYYKYYTQFEEPWDDTKPYSSEAPKGIYVGHCIAGKYFILFTQESEYSLLNYIYKFSLEDNKFIGETLYYGQLSMKAKNPIETLYYYESEDIQKVYWVDGKNPNRFINIMKSYTGEKNTVFDFNPAVSKFPNIEVETEYRSLGRFYSGVIQYFVSYYNKYGAETGIVAQSSLNYIKPSSRGGKADEVCDCSFKITLSNVDTSFDYIRVYSAQRNSLEGPVELHIVQDIPTSDTVSIIDDNVNQVTVDSSMLYYIGGSDFIASTLCQKNNTLFLGNIELTDSNLSSIEMDSITKSVIKEEDDIKKSTIIKVNYNTDWVDSINSLSTTKYFKRGEIYRFALQFQNKKGVWTTPIWVGDYRPDGIPAINFGKYTLPSLYAQLPEDLTLNSEYVKYRILRAETDFNTRSIIAQGILSPTLFNYEDRYNNTPFSVASWIMRPDGGDVPYKHMQGMGVYGEIQSVVQKQEIPMLDTVTANSGCIVFGQDNIGWYYIVVSIPSFESGASVTKSNTALVKAPYHFEGFTSEIYDDIVSDLSSYGIDFTQCIEKESFISKPLHFWNEVPGWYVGRPSDDAVSKNARMPWGYVWHDTQTYLAYANIDIVTAEELSPVEDVFKKKNNFYIDTNILTFHTPNIDRVSDIVDGKQLNFRIVGTSEVVNTTSKSLLQTDSVGINLQNNILQHVTNNQTLVSEFLYRDNKLKDVTYSADVNYTYKVHLWNKTNSISGWVGNKDMFIDKEGKKTELTLSTVPSKLKHKIFANYRTLGFPSWSTTLSHEYGKVNTHVFNSDELSAKAVSIGDSTIYYYGNYDKLISGMTYKILSKEAGLVGPDQNDSIRIKYKSTPHIVFALPEYKLLPYNSLNDEKFSMESLYPESYNNDLNFVWSLEEKVPYSNDGINFASNAPTIFIAELYREIPYESLYGGYSREALERITWIPASDATPLNEPAYLFGDTYFSYWECLKTYPFTEEDENSVVDITKVLIESFDNLQGRCDVNAGGNNILNARPTNFNLYNQVYNQSDNLFKYYILDEKFDNNVFKNQITWSLTKNPTDDVDPWTGVTLSSILNLNGEYGGINKLLNVNDNIVAFQDKAVASIQYNERTQISTESGMPVEIQNSGKVTGYQYASTNNGCVNKFSIAESPAGVYFIDSLNKTFHRLGKDGLVDISAKGMSKFFHNNDLNRIRTYYDSITHDVYLVNDYKSLLFNEDLQSFTSFMDYNNVMLFNLGGKSYLYEFGEENSIFEMFAGDYGVGLNGKNMDYYIDYVINPEPLTDKIFTNLEILADVIQSQEDYSNPVITAEGTPFDKIEIWNDYQYGSVLLKGTPLMDPLKKRFKLWRVQLPRDINSKYKNDRIRSPWAHVKLSSNGTSNKVILHNTTVKYYK